MAIIVDKEKKRSDIACSCMEILLQYGIKNLTISQIAKTAGVGKGTIYEYFENKEDIGEYVDILGLPIDYSSSEFSYRGAKNFENILKILEYYSPLEKRPKIRIGTVVTKENLSNLSKIAEL